MRDKQRDVRDIYFPAYWAQAGLTDFTRYHSLSQRLYGKLRVTKDCIPFLPAVKLRTSRMLTKAHEPTFWPGVDRPPLKRTRKTENKCHARGQGPNCPPQYRTNIEHLIMNWIETRFKGIYGFPCSVNNEICHQFGLCYVSNLISRSGPWPELSPVNSTEDNRCRFVLKTRLEMEWMWYISRLQRLLKRLIKTSRDPDCIPPTKDGIV